MQKDKTIQKFETFMPNPESNNCVFDLALENDNHIFFHLTPKVNLESIIVKGFLSATELNLDKIDKLESVSYASNSASCFANKLLEDDKDYVVLIVKFNSSDIAKNTRHGSDIVIYDNNKIQPTILGYGEIPKKVVMYFCKMDVDIS